MTLNSLITRSLSASLTCHRDSIVSIWTRREMPWRERSKYWRNTNTMMAFSRHFRIHTLLINNWLWLTISNRWRKSRGSSITRMVNWLRRSLCRLCKFVRGRRRILLLMRIMKICVKWRTCQRSSPSRNSCTMTCLERSTLRHSFCRLAR